jgi:hypothetical protein
VALVRTDVSEEPGASFIRVTKIDGVTTRKTPFFIVTAVKTSNLARAVMFTPWPLYSPVKTKSVVTG